MENKFTLNGKVQEIGELIQIRRTTKPDMYKRVLTLVTSDGQVMFPEVRNSGLKILEREGVELNCEVEITFIFQGSEKDGKRYNNILIQSIKRTK